MDMLLSPVAYDEKEILRNLLEKYLCEFAQWTQAEVNALGLYGYRHLDDYWTEDARWAYFLRVDGKLAGFAMVCTLPELPGTACDFSMAEFCVLPKYRRKGLGLEAVRAVFARHPGRWQIGFHPHNRASDAFWTRVAAQCAQGDVSRDTGPLYPDGTASAVLSFEAL